MKFTKFNSSIAYNSKIKIHEEGTTDYETAVDKAQMLHDIMQNEHILQTCTSTSSADSISAQLKQFTEKNKRDLPN